jgi:hypothetical protein
VADGVGADLAGDLDLALGDQRPRDRGAEKVLALVERVGAEHGHDEVPHEFLAQVVHEDLLHAQHLRLLARGLQFLALTQVGGEGDDFAAIGRLQPFQDDRGVEAAGIGEHHLLDGFTHDRLSHPLILAQSAGRPGAPPENARSIGIGPRRASRPAGDQAPARSAAMAAAARASSRRCSRRRRIS